MNTERVSAMFTVDIGGTPTVTFEAKSFSEARELCHEPWFKEELTAAQSDDGGPLWDGKVKLRARPALPDEAALFIEAKNSNPPSEDLVLVYLI